MVRTIKGEIKPTMAWCSLPLFWAAKKMIDTELPIRSVAPVHRGDVDPPCPPFDILSSSTPSHSLSSANMLVLVRVDRSAYDRVFKMESRPGVLVAGIGLGYQWADNPAAGASTVVVTDGDPTKARDLADSLGAHLWDRRAEWQQEPIAPPDALDQGERIGKYRSILADQADNPGGGAPSDNTEILRMFVSRKPQAAAMLYVRDTETALTPRPRHRDRAETVQIAKTAGVGAIVDVQVGGKSHELSAPPVAMQAEVLSLSDGEFVYDGPMWRGKTGHHGDSVLLKSSGIQIICISAMQQPVDLAFARLMGLDCRKMEYLCLKSTGHFRSGFGPIAGSTFNVDALGVFTQEFGKLPFKRLGRKM